MDVVRFADPQTPAVNRYAEAINAEAVIAGIPPCALAAIVALESGGRNVLQEGTDTATMTLGDGTRPGVGLCQITYGVNWSDYAHPTYAGYDLWDPAANLYVAAAYFFGPALASALRLQRADPLGFMRFGGGQALWYAAAGYNEGWGRASARYAAGENPDGGTTDHYAARFYAQYAAFIAASHAHPGRIKAQ